MFEKFTDNVVDYILLIMCLITLVGVIILLFNRFVFKFRLSNMFRRNLKIEKTANIITEIKKMAQLVCLTYYEEQLGIMEKRDDDKYYFVQYNQGSDEKYDSLVVKYNGVITVGVDLSKIEDKDIVISGDSFNAVIPHSEVFEIRINPDDKEYIYKQGKWGGEEETKLYCHMKETLREHATEEGIFRRSDEIAIKNLSAWFKSYGFKQVKVYMA